MIWTLEARPHQPRTNVIRLNRENARRKKRTKIRNQKDELK